MTLIELKTLIAERHNPELAKNPGMVHQIWQDGEHTCQKSGDLLWQRTLHCFEYACIPSLPLEIMPVQDSKNSYCFCTDEHAKEIRKAMIDYWKSTVTP